VAHRTSVYWITNQLLKYIVMSLWLTNNNGSWIGWLDLLTASFTITRNHNQLQELIIFSRTLLPWLPTTPSNWTTLNLISSRHGPRTENTTLLLLRSCLLGSPRDHYPASPLARWLLPSNGLDANHIENTASVLSAACSFERVYLATGFSSSIA
jgi:hypothetical protein